MLTLAGLLECPDLLARQQPFQSFGAEAPGDGLLSEGEVGDLACLQERLEIAAGQILALRHEKQVCMRNSPRTVKIK
jgi:hypothetical protein